MIKMENGKYKYFDKHGVEITEGCKIEASVNNSVLFSDVSAEIGAQIDYSVVMRNVRIEPGAKVKYAIIADDAIIESGATVGAAPEDYTDGRWGIAVIGQGAVVKSGQKVKPYEMLAPFESR